MCTLRILVSIVLLCGLLVATQPGQAQNLKLVLTNSRLPTGSYRLSAVYDGDDSVYIIGGYNGVILDTVTKYSVSTGSVAVIGRYKGVYDGAAFMESDEIIHFGGYGTNSVQFSAIDRFSTVSGTWARVSSLLQTTTGFQAAWDRDSRGAYLFGGYSDGTYIRNVLKYNASNDGLSQLGQLPEGRASAGTAWDPARKMVYILGGTTGPSTYSRDIFTFSPSSNLITKLPSQLPYAMQTPRAVYDEHNGRAIIFDTAGLVSFDPASQIAQRLIVEGWPRSLGRPACVYVPKFARLYIFGGQGSYSGEATRYLNEISYISFSTDETSTTEQSMPTEATTVDPTNEPSTDLPSTPLPPTETTDPPATEVPPVTTGEPIDPPPTTEAPFCPPTGVHNFPYPGNCTLYSLRGYGLLPTAISVRSYTNGTAQVKVLKRLDPEGQKVLIYVIENQNGWGTTDIGVEPTEFTDDSIFLVETSGFLYPNNIDLIDKIVVNFDELTSSPPSPTTEFTSTAASSSMHTTETDASLTTEMTTETETTINPSTILTTLPPITTGEPTDPTDPPFTTETPFCPPTGVYNFPYPGNCTLYIRCFDGTEQILSCAPLLFDKVDLICKPPSEAVCDEEIPIQCPPTGYETHPHPSSCSKYYECVNGNAYESDCAPSTYFDTTPDLMHCNLAHLAVCNAECPPTGIAFIPIRSRECKWYKVCVEGNSANLECGGGEVYSPDESKCVAADAYMCPYSGTGDDEAEEPQL